MNRNFKRIFCVIALISVLIFCVSLYYGYRKPTPKLVELPSGLKSLRLSVLQDSSLMLKTVPLVNRTGICYLNTFFQVLMGIPEIVKYFITSDFLDTQPCSCIFQRAIVGYLTGLSFDLVDFLVELSAYRGLSSCLRITGGGDPGYLFERVFEVLLVENQEFFINFFVCKQVSFDCSCCEKRNFVTKNFVCLNVDLGYSVERSVMNYLCKVQKYEPLYREYQCEHCFVVDRHVSVDVKVFLPRFLVVESGRVGFENKREFFVSGKVVSERRMYVDGLVYELVGQVCIIKQDEKMHVFAIVCKNNDWILCDDEKITRGYTFCESSNCSWILIYRRYPLFDEQVVFERK